VNRPPFTDATLNHLRSIGDPAFAAAPARDQPDPATYFASVANAGVAKALGTVSESWSGCVTAAAETEARAAVDWYTGEFGVNPAELVTTARDLFAQYGDEISAALLLAALPETYATAWGARVLVAHGDLVWQLPRRIRETALFLATVLSKHPAATHGDPVVNTDSAFFKNCAGLRLFHHMLRIQLTPAEGVVNPLGDKNTVPLNQEDLLGTLLTFSVTTFRVMEQFGVHWTADEQDAYLFFWDLVGGCLGIGTQAVSVKLGLSDPKEPTTLRPSTVEAASAMLDQLHARQWLPVQGELDSGRPFPWEDLVPGRALVDALLRALSDSMPAMKQPWPAIVMRELAPTAVRSRLGLERTGLVAYAADRVALRTTSATPSRAATVRAATLRAMANDVTRHAMYSFLKADGPPFKIPGFDLSQLTPPKPGPALAFNP
jgi:ER-bound oxygenase mpaB/B'/Rubber oxygenase, catalytic domain